MRSADVKNYLYHWIRHLRRIAGADRIAAFPFLGEFEGLTPEESLLGPFATWPRLGLLYFVNLMPVVPAIDWIASRDDIFHASNQVRNPPRKTRLTATIHDLTCWILPALHTPANVRAALLDKREQRGFRHLLARCGTQHANGWRAVLAGRRFPGYINLRRNPSFPTLY